MEQVISIIQIILAALLIVVILLQQKGTGLGSGFGGGGGGGGSFYRTKRGAEKLLFYATIVISGAFILSSLVGLLL